MRRQPPRDLSERRDLARRRLAVLERELERAAKAGNLERAQRYYDLARRLAMRAQLRLRREFRHRGCRRCGALLWPGATARVRVRAGAVRTTCARCGRTQRHPTDPRKRRKQPWTPASARA